MVGLPSIIIIIKSITCKIGESAISWLVVKHCTSNIVSEKCKLFPSSVPENKHDMFMIVPPCSLLKLHLALCWTHLHFVMRWLCSYIMYFPIYTSTIDMKITDHTFDLCTRGLKLDEAYICYWILTHPYNSLGLIMLVYNLGYLLYALDELVSHGLCS
jgi:hypothetical protein